MEYAWKISLIFFLSWLNRNDAMALPVCPQDQYRVGENCCYPCDEGSRILTVCSKGPQNTCWPCAEDTFHKGPNKQKNCTACTRCDEESGLRLKESCTETSDAVCDTLEGWFCADPVEGGCRRAQRHSVSCPPGHHVGQTGTADKDTECLKCPIGTFSNGTSATCQLHTKCESLELDEIQPGTAATNSECGERGSNTTHVVAIIPPIGLAVASVITILILLMRKQANNQPSSSPPSSETVQTQEESPDVPDEEKKTMLQN